MRGRHNPRDITGDKHPNWKGGRYINTDGYVFIYSPTHPNKTKAGHVMEHWLVMEQAIGRYLKPDEVVHHKDSNPQTNDISNLELTVQPKHASLHNTGVGRRAVDMSDRICCKCEEKKTPPRKDRGGRPRWSKGPNPTEPSLPYVEIV